jgi:uncharacterized protein involved in outer membrane biogenesis
LRNFLTFIAVALVTALLVALVAPPLIDWSARREMVARAVSGRIGAPVKIGGAVTLRLLPIPYLDIADVAIGPSEAPWIAAPAMRVEFGIGALFGGRIRLQELRFERPNLRVGPRFGAPAEGPLEFGRLRIHHGELRVERDGAAPILLHDVDLEASAPSARGPWRASGDFAGGEGRLRYQLNTETVSGAALPIKLSVEAGTLRADLDGEATLGPAPVFAGTATVSGALDAPQGGNWPWRIEGRATAQGDAVRIDEAHLRLGEAARALEAEGGIGLSFGERPALEANLHAKTLNFDALLRSKNESSAPPARAFAALAALIGRAPAPGVLSLKLESGSAYLGARALDAPQLSLETAPDGTIRLQGKTGLPGQGRLALDGALDAKPSPAFHGHAEGRLGAFGPLAAWLAEGDADLGARLADFGAALPEGDIAASGDVAASREGVSVRGLDLGFGATRFTGGVVYALSANDKPGRLFLDLATDALDMAQAPNVEAGLAWLGPNDLDFRLKAGALKLERVGLSSARSGALTVRARKDGPKFALEKLAIADLGGASFQVEGESSPSGRWTRVSLDAGRLVDLAALVAHAAPGAWASWFVQHADALGSAKATFEARRDGPPLSGPFGLDFLKADGALAGARFALQLSRAPAPVDAISAQATLDAPDMGALLRKIGAKISGGSPGRAELSVSGTGLWDRGFEGKARLALAGSVLTLSGALRPDGISGPLTLKSADVFPALAALGFGASGLGVSAPADMTADLSVDLKGARLTKLAGAAAGSRVGGDIVVTPALDPLEPAPPATITGRLDLDRANAGGLVATLLGRPGPSRPGAIWPETKLGAALLTPPRVDVTLKIDALDLGFGLAHAATGRLRLDRDRLAFDDISLMLNGGQAGGRGELRRDKTQATATGAVTWQGVGVDRAALRGRFDGALDFAGVGETTSALLANLAGTGRAKAVEATIPRLDADALARTLARLEQAGGTPPEGRRVENQISADLDHAALALKDAEGPLSLNGGALRFGPVAAPARDGSARVAATLGLVDLTLGVEATLIDAKPGPFWSGAAPSVTVSGRSGLDAAPGPRRVEATLLSAGLAAEAVARESERIAGLEADMRERAAFNRRFKADRFTTRRQAEIDAFLEEQEKRRLADEYRAAYDAWAASHREAAP